MLRTWKWRGREGKARGETALEEAEGEHGEPRELVWSQRAREGRGEGGRGTFTSAIHGEITSSQ